MPLRFILAIFVLTIAVLSPAVSNPCSAADQKRPNILWITSEDNGPHLGCYGDDYADTPHLDALAEKGMRYDVCWSNAPVCAPARTTIIAGVYPTSFGSQHMRSAVPLPKQIRTYPEVLRDLGYYCTNHTKEDYNYDNLTGIWNGSGKKAHWKNREADQPFFAIFNFTISHESKIRNPHTLVHDPAKAPVPAYHPDIPEVRRDWAQYYDRLTEMDAQAGQRLKEVADAGLADDTIVFYYGDHGSGMPRSKRWPYNSGLHVPLIVYVPEKWKHLAPEEYSVGGTSSRLVSFVDLAATVISLAGEEPPANLHGKAFMGKHQVEGPEYLYGYRGRMDERIDLVRSVRDQRYVYIRQYMPHRPCGQFLDYMFQTVTTQKWKQLFDEGKLNEAQSHFWTPKPTEELYDLQADPDEVNNLADNPEYTQVLHRLRTAHQKWVLETRDIGFLPEAEMHRMLNEGETPYDIAQDDKRYPLADLMVAADRASDRADQDTKYFQSLLKHPHAAMRYWGATAFLIREKQAVHQAQAQLAKLLDDESPNVRIVAAEALGRFDSSAHHQKCVKVLIDLANPETNGIHNAIASLNAIDYLDQVAQPVASIIQTLPGKDSTQPRKFSSYALRLQEKILRDMGMEKK